MALSLAEIRAKLQEQQAKKERGKTSGSGDNATYAFWNNPEGSTATLRFLPDGDQSNDLWWQERLIIKLPFPSIKGQMSDGRQVEVQVPCMDMWKPNSCPVNAEIRPWWKGGKDLEDMAIKYWRKKSFLFQGFVTNNPNQEDLANLPENPIRRFVINPSVFDRIKAVFLDQEVENDPISFENGLDFRLVKGSKGGYADYGTSSWGRKERALNEVERAAITTHGLFNLSNFLPKKPDDSHLQAIIDLFRDSVDEKPYDPDKYAQYYKPYGLKTDTNSNGGGNDIEKDMVSAESRMTSPRNITITAPAVQDDVDDAPFDGGKPIAEKKSGGNTQDILEALRRRQAAKS